MKLPWQAGPVLPPREFAELRRRAIFDCCKWDPQVEDVSTLAPFPLILDAGTWHELSGLAEQLAREALTAERELLERLELHRQLAVPRLLRAAFKRAARFGPSRGVSRLMRFDFHRTGNGWKISEANTDVPGGFNEASGFTQLMASHHGRAAPAGDPAAAYAQAIAQIAGPGGNIALVFATAYTDDRQVMAYLARHLERLGLTPHLASPAHLRCDSGHARVSHDTTDRRIDLVVRFFPGEWLPNLGRRSGWPHFVCGSRTPLSNPVSALLTQSKRFPLVWGQLRRPLHTWRSLLPETRDVREVRWSSGDEWVLKPAWGRVGHGVAVPGVTEEKEYKQICRSVRWHPRRWVAQRRFDALPLETELGNYFPCIGVYTIDGRAAGIYGRLATQPLIDWKAQDVAVLVADSEGAPAADTNCPRAEVQRCL